MASLVRLHTVEREYRSALQQVRHTWTFLKYPNHLFDEVKNYVMFIGYAHSGHSVVGAILDAHPNMVVANELHALPKFKQYRYDKHKMFKLILENSRQMAQRSKRTNTGYNYNIPHLHQGRFVRLEVIGDKKGGASALYHSRHPEVFDRVVELFGHGMRTIHVVRNPFDNISAYAHRRNVEVNPALIDGFFARADAVMYCESKLPRDQFYTLHYEDLVQNKFEELSRLCGFLDQEPFPQYIDGCSQALYDSPHKRRYKTHWTEENKARVRSYIESGRYARFFGRYSF